MSNSTTSKDLINEKVQFIQHHLPGLDAGNYQLTVNQSVEKSDGTPVTGASYTDTKLFAVKGDRFTISKPSETIHSVFPSGTTPGDYGNVLPQVLFSQKTFPWIRMPNSTSKSYSSIAKETDSDVATWLWVMLLDDDDVKKYPSLNLTPVKGTINDLYPTDSNTIYSYFDKGVLPPAELDAGEEVTDAIKYIDIPQELFWNIAPSIDDLKLLAHGRTVSMDSRDSNTSKDPDLGSYSVVAGNRLPGSTNKSHVFLVSLEGFESYLPSSDGTKPSGTFTADYPFRLAVLKSWSFFSSGESADFVNQLEKAGSKSTPNAGEENLVLSYKGNNHVIGGAISMGYTPVNETLRTGEKTVSWYRGPFAPYDVAPQNFTLPFASPDSALNYDPTTGMLDVSYAAAWELGRLFSLQDKAFSIELYNWKKGLSLDVVNQIEQELIDEMSASLSNIDPVKVSTDTENGTQSIIQAIINHLSPKES